MKSSLIALAMLSLFTTPSFALSFRCWGGSPTSMQLNLRGTFTDSKHLHDVRREFTTAVGAVRHDYSRVEGDEKLEDQGTRFYFHRGDSAEFLLASETTLAELLSSNPPARFTLNYIWEQATAVGPNENLNLICTTKS